MRDPPGSAPATLSGPGRVPREALARSTGLNLLSGALPLLVALVTMPVVIRGFGVERYGVLATAMVLLAYLALLDLGLGRAVTSFLSRSAREGDGTATCEAFWTALGLDLALGVAAGAALALLGPALVGGVLKVPSELVGESRRAFRWLALAVPFAILTPVALGALEAHQRFDLANLLQVPAAILGLLAPLIVLPFTTDLAAVVAALALIQAGLFVLALLMCRRTLPGLRGAVRVRLTRARSLLAYGGWVSASNVVGPLMVNADRLVIGSLFSMRAVAYYAVPYDAVTRLWILPASVARTLFPVFSAARPGDADGLEHLAARAAKFLGLATGSAVVVVVALAPELLRLWVGEEFARQSATVLRLLAIGVLINSTAYVPYALVQGLRRPDIAAKFHLVELVLYLPALWVLLQVWGIAGAALAWTLRAALDAGLLSAAATRLLVRGTGPGYLRELLPTGTVLAMALVAAARVGAAEWGLTAKGVAAGGLVAAIAGSGWRWLLSPPDRAAVRTAVRAVRRRPAP